MAHSGRRRVAASVEPYSDRGDTAKEAVGFPILREYELLRIIADQLDCPMPPLQAGTAAFS
jgi:hypothetical protein